ncbi:hypothetical protein Rsub_11221, partial [Raphidocelis subcapitata]
MSAQGPAWGARRPAAAHAPPLSRCAQCGRPSRLPLPRWGLPPAERSPAQAQAAAAARQELGIEGSHYASSSSDAAGGGDGGACIHRAAPAAAARQQQLQASPPRAAPRDWQWLRAELQMDLQRVSPHYCSELLRQLAQPGAAPTARGGGSGEARAEFEGFVGDVLRLALPHLRGAAPEEV